HQRRLQAIRQQDKDREFELILGRNFRQLFLQRRQTRQRLQEENNTFAAQRRERQIAHNQELADIATQFMREREERLLKFEQDNADLNAQFAIESQMIEEDRRERIRKLEDQRRDEERMLANKISRELQLRSDEVEESLRIATMGAEARLELERQTQAALIAQAKSIIAGGFSTTPVPTFNNNSSSTFNNNPTFNITGGAQNPQALVALIEDVLFRNIEKIFG
ncbi:MAG: hypothetical protein CUN54_09355, partial [Phototrophicales bacterium]